MKEFNRVEIYREYIINYYGNCVRGKGEGEGERAKMTFGNKLLPRFDIAVKIFVVN